MSLSRKHRNRLSLFFGIEQRFFESNKSFEKRIVNIAYKPSIILCLTDLFNLLKFYDIKNYNVCNVHCHYYIRIDKPFLIRKKRWFSKIERLMVDLQNARIFGSAFTVTITKNKKEIQKYHV